MAKLRSLPIHWPLVIGLVTLANVLFWSWD
jgi:hypothetical protein